MGLASRAGDFPVNRAELISDRSFLRQEMSGPTLINPHRRHRPTSRLALISGLALLTAIQSYPHRASAQAGIAFVQVNSVTPNGFATTVTVPFTKAQSAGNVNVV